MPHLKAGIGDLKAKGKDIKTGTLGGRERKKKIESRFGIENMYEMLDAVE